jgi:hypothetical protein
MTATSAAKAELEMMHLPKRWKRCATKIKSDIEFFARAEAMPFHEARIEVDARDAYGDLQRVQGSFVGSRSRCERLRCLWMTIFQR